MNRSSNSHSAMFLIEMMIAILFFSLTSAVCLRMYAKSRQISRDNSNLNMAVSESGSAAELLKYAVTHADSDNSGSYFPDCLLEEYPDASADSNWIKIHYDKDWKPCSEKKSTYCMEILQTTDGGIDSYDIVVSDIKNRTEIYSLNLKLHQPNQP